MAVPGTLQEKILTVKDNYDMFGLTAGDVKVVEEGDVDALSWAVGEVVNELLEVVSLRENDRHWMDAGCHEEWDTKNKEPMKDIHHERYMGAYFTISNETTVCTGVDWKDRDLDEWCCEKCWKTERQIKKRNISLFWNRIAIPGDVGREDYLCHTYDPEEKRAYLTCNSCQKMVENSDREVEMCVECGICDLMCDDLGPLKGRLMMSGHHDLDETGEVSFFYNGDHCPSCVKKRKENYESLLWRSGRTVEDYFGSEWLFGRDEDEWKMVGPLADDSDFSDLELTSDEEEEDEERRTYRGEYENADSEDEEQSGSALEIMDKVKDIGEILFDYQEQIKDGDYLKICNLLQGIVKDSNML